MSALWERVFWFSVLLFCGLALLLSAAALGLRGTTPALKPVAAATDPAAPALRVDVQELFATSAVPNPAFPTNVVSPFYTLHFQPPPPPPTRKVQLLYQGSFTTSRGQSRAFVRMGDALMMLTNGARVVADHAVQAIAARALTLTNAAQTNVLQFNVPKTLEVPAS